MMNKKMCVSILQKINLILLVHFKQQKNAFLVQSAKNRLLFLLFKFSNLINICRWSVKDAWMRVLIGKNFERLF